MSSATQALRASSLQRRTSDVFRMVAVAEVQAAPFEDWLQRVGIEPARIYPGACWANGYNERFNGMLHREVLHAERFTTTRQAQIVMDTWPRPRQYVRPYHALGVRARVPERL